MLSAYRLLLLRSNLNLLNPLFLYIALVEDIALNAIYACRVTKQLFEKDRKHPVNHPAYSPCPAIVLGLQGSFKTKKG